MDLLAPENGGEMLVASVQSLEEPFQVFPFDPVQATFVKIVPLEQHNNETVSWLYEMRLWGKLN